MTHIALVCPGKPIRRERADAVLALAAAEFPQARLAFHPQCFRRNRAILPAMTPRGWRPFSKWPMILRWMRCGSRWAVTAPAGSLRMPIAGLGERAQGKT